MAKVTTESPVVKRHGKMRKKDKGYFYTTPSGDQKYRNRPENYQQKRTPFQKWHTESFVWAHKQIRELWQDPQAIKQITREWKDAMHYGPNNKQYSDPKGWKYAYLQLQWKTEHPFEPWYENYLQTIEAKVAEKTASEETSEYMLKRQIATLTAELNALKARLK